MKWCPANSIMAYLLICYCMFSVRGLASQKKRECLFRDRGELFSQSDEFAVTSATQIFECCSGPSTKIRDKQSNPTPPHLQLLTAIGFLGYRNLPEGDCHRFGVFQSTASCVLEVLQWIIQLTTQYIHFPYQIQIRFFMPLLNCPILSEQWTVLIEASSPKPFPFVSRKLFHSINNQIIHDGQKHILNVVLHCCTTVWWVCGWIEVLLEIGGLLVTFIIW